MANGRKLRLEDILDQRAYERIRAQKRREVIQIKSRRRLALGAHISVMFENRVTIENQIQEMLRIEKILTDSGVQQELNAYNPLIPEVGQLCATMFIELTSSSQIEEWLRRLVGIERQISISLSDADQVPAMLDEGHAQSLTRDQTTAAVHYLRFEFSTSQIQSFARGGASLVCAHPQYLESADFGEIIRAELLSDLQL